MEIPQRDELARFVREHHVHYEVQPETAAQGDGSQLVGFSLRLLASRHEGGLGVPGCPRCIELLEELREFTQQLVTAGEAAGWTEIVPEPAALHESAEMHGTDEVSLTVRLRRDDSERAPPRAGDDRRLSEIRGRLEAVGVPRS